MINITTQKEEVRLHNNDTIFIFIIYSNKTLLQVLKRT